ncbi:MAG TPA: NAD-dependent epimerase/dehydratase family protein [Thermoanaerobaculia bacterium]|nr:NAD-dependent epimerase/dehydratase family protein [Thermoanaerobaculia bacterium]
MRVFLTGATGYIGRVLARRLVEEGHEVRALVRATSRAENVETLARLGVATFAGDVGERASMREGMSGSDWVIHAAAELDPAAPPERMRAANVQGSDNVASLAWKLGVGRFLSVSSIAYFGGSPEDGSPAGETAPPRKPFPSVYSATKHAGERAIREYASRGLAINSVYPGLVYGPPGKRGGSNLLLRQLIRGRLPALVAPERKTSWVFLEDVAEAVLLVMRQAPPGRDYLLAGEVATLREVVAQVCALAAVRPPRLALPLGAARLLLAAAVPFYRLRGRRPPIPPAQLASLRRHWAFDDSRARRELGWQPRGLAQGLPSTIEYLRAA